MRSTTDGVRSLVSLAPKRRSVGLCLAIAGAINALVLSGPGVTAVALSVALLVSTIVDRPVRAYRSHRAGAPHTRSALRIAGLTAVGWALVIAVSVAVPGASIIRSEHSLHHVVGSMAVGLAGEHLVVPSSMVVDLLVGGALVGSMLAVRSLRRSGPIESGATAEAFTRAQAIVDGYGEDSLSPFILRPDKSFEFAGDGVVAYGVVRDTVVVSADPVGPDRDGAAAFTHLLQHARRAGLGVAVYGASDRYLDTYRALGLRALRVGEEAVVDPAAFSLEGRRVRKLRQSVHRVERRGWKIVVREGRDIDRALEAEIDTVEATWRASRDRLLGFAMSMGEFEPGVRPADVYALAWSPDRRLHAVMRFVSHGSNLSLDTMRRVGETPNGLNEALVCRALAFARERGTREVSLNYAGLGHLVREQRSGCWLSRTVTAGVIKALQGRFQMDRLVVFNAKFGPRWRPRYLIYETRAGLPRCMLRVLRAEGYLPQRSRSRARGEAARQAAWPASAATVNEELAR